jgi:hypothetical protein
MKHVKMASAFFGLALATNASALSLVDNDGFVYEIGDLIEQPTSSFLGEGTGHFQATCDVAGQRGTADCRLIYEPDYESISITTIENDTYWPWSCLGTWDGEGFDATCAMSNGETGNGETWQDRYSVQNLLPFSRTVSGTDPVREK